jgi:hypothetical protein
LKFIGIERDSGNKFFNQYQLITSNLHQLQLLLSETGKTHIDGKGAERISEEAIKLLNS